MSFQFEFSIQSWSAWAPGLETKEQWQEWARAPRAVTAAGSPAVKFLPPMERRRYSGLSRMALEVAYRCLAPEQLASVRSVFASRHGEAYVMLELLQSLAIREPLSPMRFSLSVHNAASGLFSIAAENNAASTAIAGKKATFCCAFLEAIASLSRNSSEPILLVMVEQPLPEVFEKFVEEEPASYALALLLSRDRRPHGMELLIESSEEDPVSGCPLPQALSFIHWLLNGNNELAFAERGMRWSFRKETRKWIDLYSADYAQRA